MNTLYEYSVLSPYSISHVHIVFLKLYIYYKKQTNKANQKLMNKEIQNGYRI